ncbi:uncharacterized protein CEXT_434721 [Caerostris extrusa]|uniref:DUF19 domain-containing protein n=1 Tax=Caerostris extrusa TaxID=172846 RepID=A0AAV4QA06_CAEEX|nr:uncharacterized protein CEXT_434721 [Caerostris extrusa]
MSKDELIEIVNCIAQSKNQKMCDRFKACDMMMPEQVRMAQVKCEQTITPNQKGQCNENERLYPSSDIISQIFDCITGNTIKLNAEENKKMVEFETCVRSLYVGNCKLPVLAKQ